MRLGSDTSISAAFKPMELWKIDKKVRKWRYYEVQLWQIMTITKE